ncbi:hypothetical protein LQR30_02645 [Chromobacterium piscinae]|uniref:hypothetical protein n=1 Tax=Chromobacterium piscinae TaxID=686831 RepID=UPI001E4F1C5C|nr:hypothetical protein [Chromobacterium piscinae]MCD4502991.1 hypothetical protein [Chromobacterium piscinae]
MTNPFPASLPGILTLCALLALLLERMLIVIPSRAALKLPLFDLCCIGAAFLLCDLLRLRPVAALQPALLPAAADSGLAALLVAGMAILLRQASGREKAPPRPAAPSPRRAFRLGNLTTSPYHISPVRRAKK